MRNFINIIEEAVRHKTPAEKFIEIVKSDSRSEHCDFSLDDRNSKIVRLDWLEGSGGLVPYLTSVADKLGVKLDLIVEVYGYRNGGKLVLYYQQNGFNIVGSDFPKMFDFSANSKNKSYIKGNTGTLRNVLMSRLPKKNLKK